MYKIHFWDWQWKIIEILFVLKSKFQIFQFDKLRLEKQQFPRYAIWVMSHVEIHKKSLELKLKPFPIHFTFDRGTVMVYNLESINYRL